jgi:hypothetical protein
LLADEAGHPQRRAPEHQLGRDEQERRPECGRDARRETQHARGGEELRQGEGTIAEGVQDLTDADCKSWSSSEAAQDLGESLSRLRITVIRWGGSETTRRVGHGPVFYWLMHAYASRFLFWVFNCGGLAAARSMRNGCHRCCARPTCWVPSSSR